MTNRFFIILTYDGSPLREGVFSGCLRQGNKEETILIPGEKLGETITFVSQTSSKATNKQKVEKATQNWLKSSPDGFVAIAYHKGWLDPWGGPHLLPFVPFSHEDYDPVYRHCLFPFSKGEISFPETWRLLGQTGGLMETLKAELLAPFLPCHLFAQSQSSDPLDKEWQDIFAESQKRLQQVGKANALEKLLSFVPLDSGDTQQKIVQLFRDISQCLNSYSISRESALKMKDQIEQFKGGLDILLGNSYPEVQSDPIAVFRHSCDNALNYLSPHMCALTSPGQSEESLSNTAKDLIEFGEDFIRVRIHLLQGAKDVLGKQPFDEIKAALESAAHTYDRLRDSLKAGVGGSGFLDNVRVELQSLEDSFRQVLGLLKQDK